MPKKGNKNYLKGVRKERRLMQELRDQGCAIVARTAGSHSPIDLFGINKTAKTITFIQSKPDSWSILKKNRQYKKGAKDIHDELDFLNDEWIVIFELI